MGRFLYRFQETVPFGGVLALGALYYLVDAGLAGGSTWSEFFILFSTSRFVHIMSLDFILFNCLLPFWMTNDAAVRSWDQK